METLPQFIGRVRDVFEAKVLGPWAVAQSWLNSQELKWCKERLVTTLLVKAFPGEFEFGDDGDLYYIPMGVVVKVKTTQDVFYPRPSEKQESHYTKAKPILVKNLQGNNPYAGESGLPLFLQDLRGDCTYLLLVCPEGYGIVETKDITPEDVVRSDANMSVAIPSEKYNGTLRSFQQPVDTGRNPGMDFVRGFIHLVLGEAELYVQDRKSIPAPMQTEEEKEVVAAEKDPLYQELVRLRKEYHRFTLPPYAEFRRDRNAVLTRVLMILKATTLRDAVATEERLWAMLRSPVSVA